ncbi:MAG: ABC transporter substrate-binding protein [Paludibacteraceae bacterium]|nr:ABC transporter substrate-binding protein [Paludibacteraceae bacterium]MBQ4018978.1 ABC transporter substrate-binding protein [Paludibacteraceae bacterium]
MKRSLIFVLCSLFFVGCVQQSTEQGSVPAGNKYATGFQITETDTGTVVEVFQPYQRVCVKQPMKRLGTMSTVQVGFLYALDALDCLAAVCNPELIYTPVKGDEIDLGDSMKPSAERVLQANLDALLAVNYGQYDNLEAARIEKLGVLTIYVNEWQEGSPLARAEWIRVLGALTGKLPQADSIFNEVETKYKSLQQSVISRQTTKIMSGNNFRGTWYVPSGKNYLAYLFKDAGADYPFYDDERETSIPLTIEETLRYFHEADVWVGAGGDSLDELAQMDEKHTWFKAYQEGRVYNWRKQRLPSGANNFWERGVVHPEEMLEDVIHILNNAPDSTLHFAVRLY